MDKLHLIAKNLIERETLEGHEIEEILKYGHVLEKNEDPEHPQPPQEGTPAPIPPETLPESAENAAQQPAVQELPQT